MIKRIGFIMIFIVFAWAISSAGVFLRYGGKPYTYEDTIDSSYSVKDAQRIYGESFDSNKRQYKTSFVEVTVTPRLFRPSISTIKVVREELIQKSRE